MTPRPRPPVARKVPKIDVVHGERRQDDYFWLRDKTNAEVSAYLEAENAYADALTEPTAELREALYREMLGRIKEDDQTVPFRRRRHFYYSRTEKGKQYPIFCRKAERLEASEEVTLDLNVLAEGHPFLALGAYAVSDDGERLAYSLDVTGFREYTLYVKDLRSGELLAERIAKVSSVAWAADPDVLFYAIEDQAKRPHRLYRHRLGAMADDLVYEEPDQLFRLHVWRSRSHAYVFAGSRSFTSTEVRYLAAARPADTFRVVREREKDHEYDVDHGAGWWGDAFFVRTNGQGLRNFRLVTAPVGDPADWTERLPHRDDVMLEDVEVFADHYVVHEREDGLVRLRMTDRRTDAAHHVAFPEPTYDVSHETNAEYESPRYRFRYQSFVTPMTVYDYDVTARELHVLKRTEVLGGYDPTRYRSERLQATAPDGTRVPISLVSRADVPGGHAPPLLLAGYGAYGLPYPVTFSSNRLSLLDRGVACAIAHVRGGGELGKRWHDEGRMLAKRNTFTDFIAVAEFLTAKGYAASDRLVIEGGSAGGLLIGAVLNMRPELVTAAVLRVPFVDVINTMLDESLPLTVGEFEEWGNPKIREHYEYMKTYCPYTNVRAQRYPTMLVKTSFYDSQVMYWEPAKYVAKLRATKIDDNPLLFKIEMTAGHGGPSGRYNALRDLAFDYAVMLDLLGLATGAGARPDGGSATGAGPGGQGLRGQ
jgi:oligopeptidase B